MNHQNKPVPSDIIIPGKYHTVYSEFFILFTKVFEWKFNFKFLAVLHVNHQSFFLPRPRHRQSKLVHSTDEILSP
jgi:hypothetical protein